MNIYILFHTKVWSLEWGRAKIGCLSVFYVVFINVLCQTTSNFHEYNKEDTLIDEIMHNTLSFYTF